MNSVNIEATHTNLKSSEEATKGKSSRNNEQRRLIKPGYEYNPAVKYLGFTLLLSYHYVLWFNSESFYPIPLLDEKITIGWLVNLLGTSLAMIVVALVLKRSNHLSSIKMLDKVVPLVLIAITLVLESIAPSLGNPVLLYGSSMIAGAFEGLMLILWGESLVRSNAKFSVIHIGATFGCTVFACMVLGLIMPNFATPIFTVILVAISGVLLVMQSGTLENDYVTLLPKKAAKPAMKTVAVVCMIGFVTSIACYYLTALAFVCLLAFLLIPITKRENSILELTSAPVKPAEIEVICQEVSQEFALSEREAEILKLLAKGNTANGIANKLVISPHTVNTHIRHIYDKVGIHKRSELLEYINMRKDDSLNE